MITTSFARGAARNARRTGQTSSSTATKPTRNRNILDELMTEKPEHARAIAAVHLQDPEEPSPAAKRHSSGIAKLLFKNKTEKEQSAKKLKKQIENAHLTLQHRAFLTGKKWDEVKDAIVAQLKVEFTTNHRNTPSLPYFLDKNDTFGTKNREIAHRTVDEVTRGGPLYQFSSGYFLGGGRFKAFKNHSKPRHLDATQLRTQNGNLFELINTPTPKQAREIEQQSGMIVNQKGNLAGASQSKVRFARDLYSGNYVAVKKFEDGQTNRLIYEVESYKLVGGLGSQERQMRFLDAVVAPVKSATSSWIGTKGYLFMPLMNKGDGEAAAKRIAALRSVSSEQAQAKLLFTAKEYAGAVADLHASNLYHLDVKPANFLHDEPSHPKSDPATGQVTKENIKISDFEGLAYDEGAGCTPPYTCPEILQSLGGFYAGPIYSKEKHDAFSLGLTLLYLKHGQHAFERERDHLCLSDGKPITLERRTFREGTGCWGIKDKDLSLKQYPLNTLDNIIAHLLNHNVKDRISPTTAHEALETLYNDMVSTHSTPA